MQETLELRGQHQVHHQQREHEHRIDRAARTAQLARLALEIGDRARRQQLARAALHERDRITERVAGREVGLDGDGTRAVVAVQAVGAGVLLDAHQARQRHECSARRRPDIDVAEIGGRLLALVEALEDHIVFFAIHGEARDLPRAKQRLQRATHGFDADAKVTGAGAVHGDPQLRLGFLVVVIECLQARILRGAREYQVAPRRELLVGAAADHETQGFLEASAQPLRHGGECAHTGHRGRDTARLRHDFPDRATPGIPVRQVDDRKTLVEILRAAETAGYAHQHALDVATLNQGHQPFFDLVDMALGVLVGGALRRIHEHEERAAVFLRRKLCRQRAVEHHRGRDHHREYAERERRSSQRHRKPQAVTQLGAGEKPAETVLAITAFQQPHAHRGRERERDQHREHHRRRHRHRELGKEPSDAVLQERDGQEHRHQHQRGRQHGKTHLPGTEERSDQRALAGADAPVDVLEHHDRVIDHQADRKHEREQREQVDAVAEEIQHDAGGDQRHRHRDRGNDHGPQIAQKEQHHQHHQRGGDAERAVDLEDGALDVDRGIPALEQVHAVGQGRLDALALGLYGPRHGKGVAVALLDDADAHHGHAVGAELAAVLGRPEFNGGHISEAHQVTVAALAHHQFAEVLCTAVAALEAYHEIPLQRAQRARGQLDVLALQHGLDIGHREVARSKRTAIEPDAHRVVEPATHPDARDTVDGRQAISNETVGVVGERESVHALAHQAQPDDHAIGGILLGDYRAVGFAGEIFQDRADAVTDVVGGVVDVAREGELDLDGGTPVTAGGRHRLDARNARDALLDGLGDARLHNRCGGTAVSGVDGHHGRVGLGILAERQQIEGNRPEGHQQQADHDRKNRPAYRNIRNDHGGGGSTRGVTTSPGRTELMPSVITISPTLRPAVTSTKPGLRSPTSMSTRSTRLPAASSTRST